MTLAQRVRDRAVHSAAKVAMREKNFGIWQSITWREYWQTAELTAAGLLALGMEVGDRVAIHSENRQEWLYTDIGATAIRAITVGLYPTNPAPEILHVLRDSGSKILIAEDQEQVDKALEVIAELPQLKHIVYLEPRGIQGRYRDELLMSWQEFLQLGREYLATNPTAVTTVMEQAQPDDIATIVYTSGTTGPPKGAMLTVDNVEFVLELIESGEVFSSPPPNDKDIVLSYLPLCHVAERLFTVWTNAAVGVQVHFAESVDTVQADLQEIQPTLLFGVPRIWEKIAAGVEIRAVRASWFKRMNFKFWIWVSSWIGAKRVANRGAHTLTTRLVYAIGWVMLYRPLRERLGVSKVRYAASGAAPVAPELLEFFMGIGLTMCEVYGMTENSAIATANIPGRVILGTVGEAQPETEIIIDETGEILTRNRGSFAGYWNNPEATAEVLDADGWIRTGDVGEWVDGTHVKITDRLKDIIITAGGKNISPSEIENALKTSLYIKEAIVIGDRRKYLTALIGIELDTVGDWAQRNHIAFTTYRDLSEKPEVVDLIQGIVNEVNLSFANVETIKQFRLLPKELDHDAGELTATQKVRRSAVMEQFADIIESMYARERV